ncbi:MAG: hypothetical protein V4651_09165 [Bacteroidota bacterium]
MKTHKKLNFIPGDAAHQLANYVAYTLIADEKDWKKIRRISKLITKKAVR